MLKRTFAVVGLAACLAMTGTSGVGAAPQAKPALPTIVVLATGGTIAGAAATDTQAGYTSGQVGVDQLLAAVPQAKKLANMRGEQISNIGSQDMNDEVWLKLAKRVNELVAMPDVAGVVITHGTDTIEETAYFLNLVVKSKKPVVLTASMRPSTALSADGPLNFFNAVAVAANQEAVGRGVLVVINDWIHGASSLTKTSTTAVQTFMSPLRGLVGTVAYGVAEFYRGPVGKHTFESEFSLDGVTALPRVDIIMAYENMDGALIDAAAAAGAKGVVIAGVGNGNLTAPAVKALAAQSKKGVVCVRSTRVTTGLVGRNVELDDDALGFVASMGLNPQKSRVLLRLALTKTKDLKEIQRYFIQYQREAGMTTGSRTARQDASLTMEVGSHEELPAGVDRRTFMMRTAVVGAAAVITGCSPAEKQEVAPAAAPAAAPPKPAGQVSADLDVVKKSKGPVMTVIDEFYKVGPGPSSSHTIGPMRITYDFYQRCTKLPADQLAKATALKVYLFGSLSATGKGHGTERAALAGIIGKEPATIDPLFLDELRDKPDQVFPVKLGDKTFNASLADIVYDAPKGSFPHPNTMTCKLMGGDAVLLEQEYYSVGGGFIEWKGYEPPKKGQPKYPYSTMKELLAHAAANKLSVAQVAMANEVAVSGKTEAEINAFIDKVTTAMVNIVKTGLSMPVSGAAGADQAEDQGRRSLQARDGRQVPGSARRGRCRRLRAGRLRGERPRPPRRDGADGRVGGRDAGAGLFARRRRPEAAAGRRSGPGCSRPRSSATSASTTRRSPGPRAGARRKLAWLPRWARRS